MHESETTIVAIATAPGTGGIGVVRLSGPQAADILAALFVPNAKVESLESHRLYPGRVTDPDSGDAVDEVMAALMRGPHSYTGEDVAEIQAHGSPLILSRIVALAMSAGARQARPGEFTERAYLNGRIDLAQAEAVADLIAARTDRARRQALEVLRGTLSEKIGELGQSLRRALAHVEVEIDFVEEDAGAPGLEAAAAEIERVRKALEELMIGYRTGRLLREGARVALVGAPNAGKSSLFNALLSEDRAIVHGEPGTTRDRLEEWCEIEGFPVRLVDTAGLREAGGVEGVGVALSRKAIEEADLLLLLVDASMPLCEESRAIIAARDPRLIVVSNKMDLHGAAPVEGSDVAISVATGEGLAELRALLASRLSHEDEGERVLLTRERHRASVGAAADHLTRAAALLREQQAPELSSIELRAALEDLAEIAGETTSDEILGLIFGEFCIGK